MRFLIAEDDNISLKIMQNFLSEYGDCDVVTDGNKAIETFKMSWFNSLPYDLICLDIMMPNVDGQQALIQIRDIEKGMGVGRKDRVKVIMTTALDDPKNVFQALFKGGAGSYIVKPVSKKKLVDEMTKLGIAEKLKTDLNIIL